VPHAEGKKCCGRHPRRRTRLRFRTIRLTTKPQGLTRISHTPTATTRDKPASTSLRWLTVLDVLSSTPLRAERRAPRIHRLLTRFASPRCEKCGLSRGYPHQVTALASPAIFSQAGFLESTISCPTIRWSASRLPGGSQTGLPMERAAETAPITVRAILRYAAATRALRAWIQFVRHQPDRRGAGSRTTIPIRSWTHAYSRRCFGGRK
jgi:hypothetical protein